MRKLILLSTLSVAILFAGYSSAGSFNRNTMVLKGSDAGMYGIRGGNGVIIIATRK